MMNSGNNNVGPFGDTTLTKVFVGGLAWETPNDALRDHFERYGDILEAVIISDKTSGRSKGYGFVTFNEPESAKKACEDPAPMINGRRANCNLASLGARKQRSLPLVSPQQNGPNVNMGPKTTGKITPLLPPSHVQWYYAPTPAIASSYIHRQYHQTAVPYYGYAPATYVATTNGSYNHKLGYMSGGAYMNGGNYTQLYPGQASMGANTVLEMYPMQHYHQAGPMGLSAQSYSRPMSVPAVLSKPIKVTPSPVCLTVE